LKKALITIAADPRETNGYYEMFRLAESTFRPYAEKWGYDYKSIWYDNIHVERWPGIVSGRTGWQSFDNARTRPYFMKIPAVAEMLESYDVVFYLDTDCLILNDDRDILDSIPADKEIALNDIGWGPFSSVSVTRSSEMTRKFWRQVWDFEGWRQCKWIDNAGVLYHLGYTYDTDPIAHVRETEYWPLFHRIQGDWIAEGVQDPGFPDREVMIFHLSHGRDAQWKVEHMRREVERRGLARKTRRVCT
jgi:hypothetical protein